MVEAWGAHGTNLAASNVHEGGGFHLFFIYFQCFLTFLMDFRQFHLLTPAHSLILLRACLVKLICMKDLKGGPAGTQFDLIECSMQGVLGPKERRFQCSEAGSSTPRQSRQFRVFWGQRCVVFGARAPRFWVGGARALRFSIQGAHGTLSCGGGARIAPMALDMCSWHYNCAYGTGIVLMVLDMRLWWCNCAHDAGIVHIVL